MAFLVYATLIWKVYPTSALMVKRSERCMPPSFERYIQHAHQRGQRQAGCIPPSFERYIQQLCCHLSTVAGCIPPSFERYIQHYRQSIIALLGCIPPSFERYIQLMSLSSCRLSWCIPPSFERYIQRPHGAVTMRSRCQRHVPTLWRFLERICHHANGKNTDLILFYPIYT